MRKITRLACIVLVLGFVAAAVAETGDGGLPGEFLRFGVGARGLGMGRAYVAVSEGADAVYWNPAGLGGLLRWEAQAMHSNLYLDSRYDFVSFAYPIHKEGGIALGFVSLGMSGLERRNSYNTELGEFGINNWALMAGYGRYLWLKRLRIGVGAKFINESVGDEKASGFGGIDIGIMTKDFFRKLRLSVVLQGLGAGKVASDQYPMSIKTGLQYRLIRPLLISAQLDIVPDMSVKPRVGVEYRIMRGLYFRAGYDTKEISAGIGYSFNRLNLIATSVNMGGGEAEVDYATGVIGPVGNDYARVSLVVRGKEKIGIEELQKAENPCERLSEYEVLLGKEGAVGAGANLITGECNFNYQSVQAPLGADPDFTEAHYYFKEAYIGKFGRNWKEIIITDESAKPLFSQKTHYMFAEATLHSTQITEETEQLINDLIAAGGDSIAYDDRLKFDLAYCLEQLGRTDSAVALYEELSKREIDSPEKVMSLYRLALIYKDKKPAQALEYLNGLVNRYQAGFYTERGKRVSYPMFPKFKDNNLFDDALLMMGDIYRTEGGEENLRNAVRCYTQLLLLSPDLDKTNLRLARERLADVYEQLGEKDLAKKIRESSL